MFCMYKIQVAHNNLLAELVTVFLTTPDYQPFSTEIPKTSTSDKFEGDTESYNQEKLGLLC